MGSRTKKKWRIEQWTTVVPIIATSLGPRASLSLRENVILTSAIIDTGLAEMLRRRLSGPQHEVVEFLGADGDGRAPCGSFGSRIQLARLLGLLTDEDVELLRRLKKLRNIVAHRVRAQIQDQEVRAALVSIWDAAKAPLMFVIQTFKRLVEGDPEVLHDFEKLPEWPKIKAQIEEQKPLWAKIGRDLQDILTAWKLPADDFERIIAAFVPIALEKTPSVAGMLMVLLSGLYRSRFDLILEVVIPLTPLELPSGAIRMWESDRIARPGVEQ